MPACLYYQSSPPLLESLLDKLHLYNLAGRLRSFKSAFWPLQTLGETEKAINEYFDNEYQISKVLHQMAREYVKRESILKSTVAEYEKPSPSDNEELERLEDRIKALKLEYHEITKNKNRLKFRTLARKDPQARQFRALLEKRIRETESRNEPVIMTLFQISKCRMAEGCCSRGCGCCSRPRLYMDAKPIYTHCTPECGCCLEYLDSI